METKKKTGMSRLMELAATKKALTCGSVVLAALAGVASFIPYLAIFYIVKEILWIYPDFSRITDTKVMNYGILAVAGIAGNIVLYFFALICSHLAAFNTLYKLKVNFASHLAKIPLGYHSVIGSGKLRKIMDENIEKVENFIAHQLPDMVAAMVAPVVMVAILLSVDWRFGLAAILGIVVGFAIQAMGQNEQTKEMIEKYQTSLEDMNNGAVEYVRGISVVKAFKQTVYSFRRLHDTINAYTDVVIPYTLSFENVMSGFTTIVNSVYLFLIPVGIFLGAKTSDYKEYAITFIFYLIFVPSIAGIMMKVLYVSKNSMQIISGVGRMDEILDIKPLSQPKIEKTVNKYDISFDNVTFAYTDDTTALKGITFNAHQGEVTAVVGPSGGGKSTIAHLIPRFFDVTEGKILIGGVDIRHMKSEYLMQKVSFVFQDVFLFKQSIMDNIRMGNEKASDEEVISAAKSAQCHDFIMKLPQGYHTVIGNNGIHLSGGEEQRIAIARAIVKDAPIVILDEATAFTDPENEHLIQKAFEKLMKDKTVIMIAHRLSTIKNAPHIIVVDEGKVLEEGTHKELMEKQGKYALMWDMYTKSLEWKMNGRLGKQHA